MTAARRGLRARLLRSPSCWLLLALALLGAFAPLVANDLPFAVKHHGRWDWPAAADLFGQPTVAPDGGSWRRWLAEPREAGDTVLLPPIPYGPLATDAARAGAGPSAAHWLGCDDLGRDVAARLVHGAASLPRIALPSVLAALLVGAVLGALAALRRGVVEAVVLRLVELTACLPLLLFLLLAAAMTGGSAAALRATLVALLWPSFARIVRGQLLGLVEQEFVHTARGLGVPERRILLRHVLPQVAAPIATTAAFCLGAAVAAEATLSYLGLAGGDAVVTWGEMLKAGAARAPLGEWRAWAAPAAALAATVVACHRVGR